MAARKLSLRESFAILGLPESSSEDEVRKTYRLKALECHPDKNPSDPEATRKFQELGEAYHRIQSGENDEDDFPDGIDPFVVFVQTMRMQQFMRNVFHAQFWDAEDEFAFPFGPFGMFGPFGPFNFPRAPDFESRRSRPSDQSGQQGFSYYSRRSHQHSRSQGEPFTPFNRRANTNGTEGRSPRRSKPNKKSHPRRGYNYKPRQTKEPNRGEDQSRQGEETRGSTGKHRSESYCAEEMNGGRSKGGSNECHERDFQPENSTESSTNQGEHTSGSKENNNDKDHCFSADVDQDTSLPAFKSKAGPKPFPQVRPKKKTKKQQRHEEWRRQEEVAKNLEKEKAVKEGDREREAPTSDDIAERVFQEKPLDSSKKQSPPVADLSSNIKQHERLAGDNDTAVIIDKGSSRTGNSNETPEQGAPLHQEDSQKARPMHYGYGDTTSGKHTRNSCCCDKAGGDKLDKQGQTQQGQNEGHTENQRERAELIRDLDHNDVPKGSQPEENKNTNKDLNDKPGIIGPEISGKNQRKNRNRRKKAKGIAVETERKPGLLPSKREKETEKEKGEPTGSEQSTPNNVPLRNKTEIKPELLPSKNEKEKEQEKREPKGNEQSTPSNVPLRNKTQMREQQGSGQTSGDDGGPSMSGGQCHRRRNPKKKPGVDAEKLTKTFQNETGKQEETGEPVENEEKPTNNVILQERTQSRYHTFGVNTGEQVKSNSTNKARESNQYSKSARSKSGKTKDSVHDLPSKTCSAYQTHSKPKDYEHRKEQKSPKEKENEGRDCTETSQHFTAASNPATKEHVYEPQVYRKPSIENNDNHQWRTGNKRKARRERKWSAVNRSCTYNDTSQAPETDFWASVMSPDERQTVSHMVPTDELEEQRQLEIVLELSKQQF